MNEATPKTGICVDASTTPKNPGFTEYRAVDLKTKKVLFHVKLGHTSNNVGEFLAIINALSYIANNKIQPNTPVYTDSLCALAWVRYKKVKSKVESDMGIKGLITEAERVLREKKYFTNIKFWDNKQWGEIPADFCRK